MTKAQFILAIDQGTTGTTVLVVDVSTPGDVSVIGRQTVTFTQHFPRTGWVEHDLDGIWRTVVQAASEAMAQASATRASFNPKQVIAIGLTNQRETLCVFDREGTQPLGRAIVWQCKRSTAIVQSLKKQGLDTQVRAKTGLLLDPYFSGTKISWLMQNSPDLASALRQERALLGTIDTYLTAKLSGGQAFVTEPSNACRTLLFNIHKGDWDDSLLDIFGVPSRSVLPEVKDSAGVFAKTKGLSFLPDGIPITGVLGDQQAALAGQTCFSAGEAKCTYGTGAFLLATLGQSPVVSKAGMLTTVAWSLAGELTYAFEGSAFIAGAAVQFIRDQLHLIADAAEAEQLAASVTASPEVYFVPALAGLGSPFWDPKAQGAFLGLTRGTTQGQLVRAVLEGIAFQVAELTRAMASDLGGSLKVLRVDGGAAANNLLMQAQADFAGVVVDRPLNLETTAFGAALFAGLGIKLYSNLEELRQVRRTERLFSPGSQPAEESHLAAQLDGWRRAVKAVQVFAGSLQAT